VGKFGKRAAFGQHDFTCKDYLFPVGIKKIRLQGRWATTEREQGRYDFRWLDRVIDDARSRGLEILLATFHGNPIYPGGGGRGLSGRFPTSEEALAAWDRWGETMATRYKGRVRDWGIWNEPDGNKALFQQYAPTIKLWPGEAGTQSEFCLGGALCNDPWTEVVCCVRCDPEKLGD